MAGPPAPAERDADESLRALSSLLWPPEPEDGELEGNPLDRDQPKPLRRDELLAIGRSSFLPFACSASQPADGGSLLATTATSTDLRALLANPLLPPLLAKVNALPQHGRYPALGKEQYLQMLLGVGGASGSQPAANARGRGGRGRGARGRGRGGSNGHGHELKDDGLTEEDLRLFRKFAACVEDVLGSVGRARRGLRWEAAEDDEELVSL